MAGLWMDDPIIESNELRHNQEETCERCGFPTHPLYRVADCDPESNFHGVLFVCASCREVSRNRCGTCL